MIAMRHGKLICKRFRMDARNCPSYHLKPSREKASMETEADGLSRRRQRSATTDPDCRSTLSCRLYRFVDPTSAQRSVGYRAADYLRVLERLHPPGYCARWLRTFCCRYRIYACGVSNVAIRCCPTPPPFTLNGVG